MSFTATGFSLFGLLLFWGAGGALLALPSRWRQYWLVFAPITGVAVISAVVWLGVHTGFSGTVQYGVWTWPVPVLLILAALFRERKRAGGIWHAFLGVLSDGLKRLPVLIVACLVLLSLTVLMDRASPRLTSFSAGSCDAADYAAGARVLREFSGDDRSGFLGHTEVVLSHSVDNFVDYWLRQNHFTPAAVIAWFSGVLGFKVHELVALFGAVLLSLLSAAAYWAARAIFRLGNWPSLLLALGLGIAGSQLYAVAHGALGQLLAASAVVILTWAGMRAWTEGATIRRGLHWVPLLTIAMWLILGAYNFLIVFAGAPLFVWLVLELVRTRDWARLARTAGVGVLALLVAGIFAPARVLGLAERFSLLSEHDFGWPVPGFSPERWLGWFGSASLESGGGAIGVILGSLLVFALAGWTVRAFRHDRVRLRLAVACLVPVTLAYLYLLERGASLGTNESYNAYKLFGAFHPLLLAAVCSWLSIGRRGRIGFRVALGLAAVVAAIHWIGASELRTAIERPVLIVENEIPDLRRIEAMDDVGAVNMVLQPFWARLWANGFLLRKPQYFQTYTYETRRPTELRGDWDLRDSSIVINPGADDFRKLNDLFYLVRRASPRFVDVSLSENWHDPERDRGTHWSWSRGIGVVRIANPGTAVLTADLRFQLNSFSKRDVIVRKAGGGAVLWSGSVGASRLDVTLSALDLPPGDTRIEIVSPQPPSGPEGDSRPLVVALYNLEVVVLPGSGR